MKNKIWAVTKYEYLQTVKRKSFWATTLFLPLTFVLILFVQFIASSQTEQLFNKLGEDIIAVHIVDKANVINPELIKDVLRKDDDLESSIQMLKYKKIDGVIYYPATFLDDGKFEIYAEDRGLLGGTAFSALGKGLVEQSAILAVGDAKTKKLLTIEPQETTTYIDKDGQENRIELSNFILPVISLVIFFLAVTMSSQYLLQSVSEEKENRMIETMLSMVNSRSLIYGKIIGLSGVVLTQVSIWLFSALAVLFVAISSGKLGIAIDVSKLSLNLLPFNLLMTLLGFLLFAAIMVGVGSVGTSYRDSQSLSGIFIMLSFLPLYFITVIIADPNGIIAKITSYVPFTAPMILVIRNSLGALSTAELVTGVIAVFLYVAFAFWLATKLFDLGALMYNRRPNAKEIWKVMRG